MKKSFNVNLGGRIFQIDEDAYEQLSDYLVSVKTCFRNNECGEEIASDIEARLGELFEARVSAGSARIITLTLVNEMIARMGKPESMVDDGEAAGGAAGEKGNDAQEAAAAAADGYVRRVSMGKKLFRDGDNKVLGGVVSGLAAYFNMNVTLLRVIAVLLFFLSTFWAFLLYLVMWAVVPLALTTTDKLRMQGVEPTPENIAEKLAYEEPAIDKIVRNLKEVDNSGISTLLVILGCVLFISTFIGAAGGYFTFSLRLFPLVLVLCWIGTISVMAIPVIAIVLVLSNKWKGLSASVKWLLLIDWMLAIVQVVVLMSLLGASHFSPLSFM
ncbi:MAG: PspC domain-containing protein [Bacteroidaceae bacterium]|nr:PspC domain-containing protein [Bacteroidaceae bacterium]